MIVAHHLGEDLIPTLVAGGAATAPALVVAVRVRLSRLGRAFRRQPARLTEPERPRGL